ncbi:MAG: hypothetical protein A3I14_07795 [Candidatus Rokubacteria bacterium RIFCSPLOWO2_02_FULL_73_56]|nr:MAG: hypothetical protein A3D33_06770 [Candidatus Rokubacteria bacterium RIFCSPHIGHO2_02_FULL_73_26]OGL07562.1 MAG: hypothetical protein A3I14_07795 [Candidatus Rokubacteria bacterium RIFCSPLOWO2_02_FULL_73_56]OGL21123.1 MAG: hypothetical protein A3G44_15795 [Candidatus Rokubacteria bacterium RIFCSPLOWO2_12_FULL_73_47]
MGELGLLVAGAGGMLLGVFYFGALWLVVRRLPRVASPALLLGVTGLVRLAVVVTGFYLLVDERWARLASALVGFLAVRVALTRRLGGRVALPRGAGRDRTTAAGE